MGTAHTPEPVTLIVGLLSSRRELLAEGANRLVREYGALDMQSEPVPFNYTTYYRDELGEHPWRQFLAFADLIDPGALADVKTRTNALEQEWAVDGKRALNFDPGYVSLTKLVLATTKNYWHRIYIGRGIYAEATLPFRGGAFQPQAWTYPDYRAPEHLAFFTAVRERYRRRLRAGLETTA